MAGQTARMRTISGAIREIKAVDPNTEFREWALRKFIKSRVFKGYVKVGSKYLVNMDELESFLKSPQAENSESISEYGKLRQVKA